MVCGDAGGRSHAWVDSVGILGDAVQTVQVSVTYPPPAAAAAAGHPPHQPLRELETHQGQDEPLHGAGVAHRSPHTSETAADGLSCLDSLVLYREAITPPYLLTSIFHYHHAHPQLQGFHCILGHEDFEEFVSLARRSGENRATHIFHSKIKALPSDKRPALIAAKRGVTQTSLWWGVICVCQNLFKPLPKSKVLAALGAGWKHARLLSAVLPPGQASHPPAHGDLLAWRRVGCWHGSFSRARSKELEPAALLPPVPGPH